MLTGLTFLVAAMQSSVTVAFPAGRVEQLLAELTPKAGEALRANVQVASNIVAVHCTNRPLQEVKAQLAHVLYAKWRKTEDGWTLEPDQDLRAAALRQGQEAWIVGYREAVAKLKAKLAPNYTTADAQQTYRQLIEQERDPKPNGDFQFFDENLPKLPSGRALIRLLDLVNPRLLSDGDTLPVVFSNAPKPLQYSLGPKSDEILETLRREHASWCEASRGQELDLRNGVSSADPRLYPDVWDAGKARIFLKVGRNQPDQPYIAMFILDRQNQVIQCNYVNLGIRTRPPQAPPALPEIADRFALSSRALEFIRAVPFGEKPGEASQGLIRRLIQPEIDEPLLEFPAEVIRSISAPSRPIVAALPDASIYWFTSFTKDGTQVVSNVGEALRALRREGERVSLANGWVRVRSAKPVQNQLRSVVGPLLREANAAGIVGLGTLSKAMAQTSDAALGPLENALLEIVSPGLAQDINGYRTAMIAFYGSLGPTQQSDALARKPVKFASLNPRSLELLRRAVIDASEFRMREIQRTPTPSKTNAASLLDEPTELLTGGLKGDMFFVANAIEETVVKVTGTKTQYGTTGIGRGRDIGAAISRREQGKKNTDLYDGMPGLPYTGYQLGSRSTILFEFLMGPNLAATPAVQVNQFPKRNKSMPLSSLPEAVRKEIEAGQAQGG